MKLKSEKAHSSVIYEARVYKHLLLFVCATAQTKCTAKTVYRAAIAVRAISIQALKCDLNKAKRLEFINIPQQLLSAGAFVPPVL